MCGIAGFVSSLSQENAMDLLYKMNSVLAHRGPDDHGTYQEGSVYLAHQRLSILDLSEAGRQPMSSNSGSLVISYNGEVYNYVELKRELEKQNVRFTTGTDTEVILESFSRRNSLKAYNLLNGMFAFALYDRLKQKLHLVRDRFGIKPLYYLINGKGLFFASEIKSLLVLPFVKRRINTSSLGSFLSWGLLDHSAETFYENIYQVPPGHELVWDLKTNNYFLRCYYDLQNRIGTVRHKCDADYVEEFRGIFENSVKIRLRSDVVVGSCLSGGLDSSAIVGAALQAWPDNKENSFNTITSCQSDSSIDEWEYASEFSVYPVVRMNKVFPDGNNFWKDFDKLIYIQDGPFTTASIYAQWCVMKKARQEKIQVLLDGQGGDELMCGYRKFYAAYLHELLKCCQWHEFLKEIIFLLKTKNRIFSAPGKFWRYLPDSFKSRKINPSSWLSRALLPEKPNFALTGDVLSRQILDIKHYSLPSLLHYEDRNSMAFSIEARTPFLDYRLVEYLLSVPTDVKLKRGITKKVLRSAMKDKIPEKIILRRSKLGFEVPETAWYQKGIRDFFENQSLHESRLVESGFIPDRSWKEMKNSANGLNPFYDIREIFRFVCAETWMKTFDMA